MEKLCIDVRGFSEEKKKRVQDAFFELGYRAFSGTTRYLSMDAVGYCASRDGRVGFTRLDAWLNKRGGERVTYAQLMQKAGLDDSEPDEDALGRWVREGFERRLVMTESAGVKPIYCDLSDDIFSTVQAINQCENDIIETKLLNHLDALLAEQLRRHTK